MQKKLIYLRCFQRAIFNSVISPAPEIRLISRSFLLMAIAVTAEIFAGFEITDVLDDGGLFCLDFINKGYTHNVYILYFMR